VLSYQEDIFAVTLLLVSTSLLILSIFLSEIGCDPISVCYPSIPSIAAGLLPVWWIPQSPGMTGEASASSRGLTQLIHLKFVITRPVFGISEGRAALRRSIPTLCSGQRVTLPSMWIQAFGTNLAILEMSMVIMVSSRAQQSLGEWGQKWTARHFIPCRCQQHERLVPRQRWR
jgi:hypothetical protein